jgi:hypothetical protein
MQEQWGWPGALGAAIVVTIFAAIAISAGGGWVWFGQFRGADAAAWAQAIGSMLAVGVALGLAGQESRRRRAEAYDRATLVAARLSELVVDVLNQLNLTSARMVFADDPAAEDIAYLCRAVANFKAALDRFPTSELSDLVPLANRTAHRLARAFAMLEGLANDIQNQTSGPDWFQGSANRRAYLHQDWSERLRGGIDLLTVAKVELDRAANTGAPAPTDQELYGDGE